MDHGQIIRLYQLICDNEKEKNIYQLIIPRGPRNCRRYTFPSLTTVTVPLTTVDKEFNSLCTRAAEEVVYIRAEEEMGLIVINSVVYTLLYPPTLLIGL